MIRDILDFQEGLIRQDIVVELSIPPSDFMENIYKILGDLHVSSELAKEVLFDKISEKDFCKLRNTISKLLVTLSAVEGHSILLLADRNDELVEYTDSMLLGIIGLLIQEEIL